MSHVMLQNLEGRLSNLIRQDESGWRQPGVEDFEEYFFDVILLK